MYFKVGKEHFCYARCIRVVVAFACIQGFHGFHFFIGELEVEDVDVSFDSFLVGGFREDDESFLVFEAEDDLAQVLSVFFSEGCDDGAFKEGFVSVAERVPCFEADVVFCHELTDFLLLVERVAFDLVDAWHGVELRNEGVPDLQCHVGNADGADLAFFLGFFHSFPCARYVAVWLMDEVEVDVAET